MRLIDADEIIAYCKRLIEVEEKQGSDKMNYGQERVFQTEAIMQHIQTISPTIDAIPRETVFDFKVKLDKWMFHNHESVCGQRMIDIDYLDGEIWELFQELGIVRYDDDGNLIDEVSKE